MGKLSLFMIVSLDGFFEGPNHDLSWHNVDTEFNEFAAEQISQGDTLLFGRKTYELMASYWPTESARKDDPVIARFMNTAPKIVFSRTLKKVKETEHWKNVRLVKDNVSEEIQKLKSQAGKNLTVLGSNNLCVSLLQMGLLDELRIMVNPVVIGEGTPLFKGIKDKLSLKLLGTRMFRSGNVLLNYKPEKDRND